MRNSVLLLVVLATQASAEAVRCGTDDFGNTVCMDGNGVLTVAPAASAVSSVGSVKDDDRRVRCGIDPFGNKVCR
ncbi:MAG: hypothetical protein A2063_07725 [Gallionellales bacterium GWA2_60_142]|jgi:hypothetical protein|nr:MAG: hypothetical protein A2063_07725 [Gallionellales bacterium GWA2_60_142]HCI13697.1 hypothetical protein [Gallionellaceae bacterium]